jgi:U3 small nucleolar RNA-associated protein 22
VAFDAAGPHLRALGADASTALRWAPPEAVHLAGAAALGAAGPPSELLADVALRLPAACLREKDYLDCRYNARRCLYLARIAAALANTKPPPEWAALSDDPRKAVLIIAAPPAPGLPRGTRLRLLPCISPDVFPAARLAPGRGNLRAAGGASVASPAYNAGISEDVAAEAHLEAMRVAVASAPAFGASLVLLKAWARRRGMLGAPDGVSGCLLGAACAALLSRGVLVAAMSPFQMFREALRALGDVALLRKGGLQVGAAAPAAEAVIAPWRVGAAGGCVVLSACGRHNWACRLGAGAAAELAAEAGACAAALTAGGRGAADAAFLAHAPPVYRHDLHVLVPLAPRKASQDGGDGALAASDALPLRAEEAAAEAALTKALGSRARRVRVVARPLGGASWWASGAGAWPADGVDGDGDQLLLLACLDPEQAARLVDLGPSAEDKAAASAFRAFWGAKAELRRFADGAIAEAVVWADGGALPRLRAALPGRVAEYALKRHVARSAAATQPPRAASGTLDLAAFGDAGDAPQGPPLVAALDRLGAMLKALKALPLRVAAVAPLSPAFRGMAAAAPAPHPLCGGEARGGVAAAALRSGEALPAVVEPLELVISLEGSGSWPAEPAAATKTRAAFALAACAALRAEFGVRCAPCEACPDVFFEGYAFRLHVTSEADMRKTAEAAEEAGPSADADATPPLAVRLAHASALAGAAAAHPALAPTARLVKRLLGAHLLSAAVREEAIELLVAAAFLHPRHGGAAPASRETGALAVLALLGEHDWAAAPLAVDLGGGWGGPSGRDAALHALRVDSGAGKPRAAMRLPTPSDPRGEAWTRGSPCAAALGRACAVARVAQRRLADALLHGGGEADALHAALFTPSLRGFDAVVRLRHAALPHFSAAFPSVAASAAGMLPAPGAATVLAAAAASGAPPAKLRALPKALLRAGDGAARRALLVGFDPLRLYAADLRRRLGHAALFFAPDGFAGGDALAVAMRPGALEPRPALRLPLAPAAAPAPGGGVALSMVDFAAELADCGAGLVEAVLLPPPAAKDGGKIGGTPQQKSAKAAVNGGAAKRARPAEAAPPAKKASQAGAAQPKRARADR